MSTESIYKAMASYLKSSSIGSSMKFYPSHAPQTASDPYCVLNLISNDTDIHHGGSFDTGNAIFQFDFFSKTLATLDNRVESLKNAFVGQSINLTSGVTISGVNSQNEFDDYDDKSDTYIRSIDLVFKYIFN
tara:strand:+ start:267 stop:662 length:396 start_codon:yes stop_codon:yes gene_type:complete